MRKTAVIFGGSQGVVPMMNPYSFLRLAIVAIGVSII
jgi:hypothetical protein